MGRITASRKQLKGDPVYNSDLASKFINCLMYDGKKTAAQNIFYDALKILENKVKDGSLKLIENRGKDDKYRDAKAKDVKPKEGDAKPKDGEVKEGEVKAESKPKENKDNIALEIFIQALENVKPNIEVRSKRVGGASYQVPMPVRANRAQSLCIRWILGAVRDKKGQPTAEKLASELSAAYNREGVAFTKRENVHKMAEANKAFAHFAN